MKFITVRSDGGYILNDNGIGVLPDGGMAISDEEYQGLSNESLMYVNGAIVPATPNTPTLAEVKAQAQAAIDAQLAALDIKRIRPTAEGDTAYLATLNDQAVALRAQRAEL